MMIGESPPKWCPVQISCVHDVHPKVPNSIYPSDTMLWLRKSASPLADEMESLLRASLDKVRFARGRMRGVAAPKSLVPASPQRQPGVRFQVSLGDSPSAYICSFNIKKPKRGFPG